MNITQSTQIGLRKFTLIHTHTHNKIGKANLFGVVEKHLKRKNSSNEKHTLHEKSDQNNLRGEIYHIIDEGMERI